MAYQFSDPAPYLYKEGDIFLGVDDLGREIGVTTERHALGTGGARSGKGAALLIPNLLRWKSGVLTIDPKGENTEATWQAREAMGQKVVALDPFSIAKIPARLRGGFNPLAGLTPQTPRIREKLMVLADGMVVSHDPKHMDWVEGTRAILAGVMAFNVTTAPDEFRNLSAVRKVLLLPDDQLLIDAQEMMNVTECGGLVKAAGQAIVAAITATSNSIEKQCLQKARAVTRWLDSPEIAACLSRSSFDLAELRGGDLSLFLILNPDDIEHYSMFFRMFVRSALAAMMEGGSGNNADVLFLLDEFNSLGKLDTVAKSAGLMPSYGVHLFPFLQDLGQLQDLYGATGAETFFGNADAQIFFGNTDPLTLKFLSERLGRLTPDEITTSIPAAPQSRTNESDLQRYQDEQAAYGHQMKRVGQPRLTPSEVAALVGKGHGDKVARSMIVFAKSGDVLNLSLMPYFAENPAKARAEAASQEAQADAESWRAYLSTPTPKLMRGVFKNTLLNHYRNHWFLYVIAAIWTAIATFGGKPYRVEIFYINAFIWFVIPPLIACWREVINLGELKRQYFPERYQNRG